MLDQIIKKNNRRKQITEKNISEQREGRRGRSSMEGIQTYRQESMHAGRQQDIRIVTGLDSIVVSVVGALVGGTVVGGTVVEGTVVGGFELSDPDVKDNICC